MEVQLSFGARQQFDKGGRLGAAIDKAQVLLAVETLPKEVTKLSREEALEEGLLDEEDQEDDDDEDDEDDDEGEESDDGNNIWVISVGETNVYFAQPTPDLRARLIIRAV
ncbi:MAG: hypothetical protein H0T42_27110 [Deltaproteobacteria bacterium]|nr:hypothetical protein [Deltaproteobacteria bacterium]